MLSEGQYVEDSSGGKWKIGRLCGQGTCCEVYSAVSTQGNEAAFKIYKNGVNFELAHDCEAMLLKLVSHSYGPCPQIVENLDDFDHGAHACLLQEILGFNLREMIASNYNQSLSLHVVLKLTRDILHGLNALHKLGFIHGDLKLTNLLWGGRVGSLTIIDFSLSCHVGDENIGKLQSQGYRAPEVDLWNKLVVDVPPPADCDDNTAPVIPVSSYPASHSLGDILLNSAMEGSKVSRPRRSADVWSVGCILVEMLTGKKMFTSENIKKLERKKEKDELFGEDLLKWQLNTSLNSWTTSNTLDVVLPMTDLILKCLTLDADARISPEAALQHPVFSIITVPSHMDMMILTSPVLRITNMAESCDLQDDHSIQALREDILSGCEPHVTVVDCVIPVSGPGRGKVYVEFELLAQAVETWHSWCHRTFNGHSIILNYFPLDAWKKQNLF